MTEQSASLPGSVEFSSADLRRVRSRALRAASRARCGLHGLHDHGARLARVLLEELAEAGVDDRLDEAGHPGVAELGLRLALELRVAELDRDHRGQALADVLAGEVVLFLLEQAVVARVLVERARQRRAEAAQVGAALARVDVVGERVDRLLVGGVPLHRDLGRALLGLAGEEDDLAVDGVLVLVEVGDEVLDPALVAGTRAAWPSPRSSTIEIFRPRVRKAVSRRRSSSVWKSKSSVSKISASGRKVTVVPVPAPGSSGSPLIELPTAARRARTPA